MEHEPHCPLYKNGNKFQIGNRCADKVKKIPNFRTKGKQKNLQKSHRIPRLYDARTLVDKYFDS